MKAKWGERHWNYPDKDYRVKRFRVGNRARIKRRSPILRQYWGAYGTIVFINSDLTQQIKVALEGRWIFHGIPKDNPSAWFSEEDLIAKP